MSDTVNNAGRRNFFGLPVYSERDDSKLRRVELGFDRIDNVSVLNFVLGSCRTLGKLVPGARVVNISTCFGDLPRGKSFREALDYNTFLMRFWTDPVSRTVFFSLSFFSTPDFDSAIANGMLIIESPLPCERK